MSAPPNRNGPQRGKPSTRGGRSVQPQIGLDGKEINPYIPRYISNAPWYLEKSDDYLQHQRSTKEVIKGEWYDRGNSNQKNVPAKFRKGACTNCGAMTHKAKECLERPRKVGAKYSGLDLRADDNIQDIKTTWDSKRDRWNGYDADEYKGVVREFEHEQQIKEQAEEEERLRKIRLGLTDVTAPGGGDSRTADDGDPDKKLTTRTLRVREDKAQYLTDLSEDSAVFNPKSRTLRSEAAGSINDRGLFVRKLTDEAEAHSALREYADAAAERGEAVSLEAGPTEAVLRLKQRRAQEEAAADKLRRELLDKYGGEEYLEQGKRPREVLEAPVEEYHEYTATGELKQKKPKLTEEEEDDAKSVEPPQKPKQDVYAKSKYQEDIYPGNHTSVWGSYWKDGKWGFACCHSSVRQSYCLGTKGREINDKPKE
jgi:pre-mRNA-processing factor SLU7